MKPAVLLLAHGAPERVEDVEAYLSFVRGKRPGSPEVLEEVRHRYRAIGGAAPLLSWTRAQAEALQGLLGIPVFFGMRNWNPFIREAMAQVRAAGIDRIAAVCLAPQYSELSVGLYIKRTEEAAREAGVAAPISWARSFHDEPLLIEAFAGRLNEYAMRRGPLAGPGKRILFTAHSLPEQALGGRGQQSGRGALGGVAHRAGQGFDLGGHAFGYGRSGQVLQGAGQVMGHLAPKVGAQVLAVLLQGQDEGFDHLQPGRRHGLRPGRAWRASGRAPPH